MKIDVGPKSFIRTYVERVVADYLGSVVRYQKYKKGLQLSKFFKSWWWRKR